MRTNYGKSLRKFFAEKKPLKLIDLGPDVFESATVDTNILLIKNCKTHQHYLEGLTLRSKNQITAIKAEDMMVMENLGERNWIVLKPEEQIIKDKIEQNGTPLVNWDIKINRGVLTGYNPAFIIDRKTKDYFIEEDPKCSEIIKPILRGRDIKRYKAEFANLWLINTHNGYKTDTGKRIDYVNINNYPILKLHLDKFWTKIEPRRDQGRTPYNLRNCTYLNEFEKEKIVWKRIGSVIRFAHSYEGEYSLDSTVIMTGEHMKYLVGILNSKLMIRELRLNSPKTGTGDVIISVQALNPLYVHKPSSNTEELFTVIVDRILTKKEAGEDTTSEEQQIDLMVYKLYDLTYDEVLIVDPQPPFSRDKYEQFSFEQSKV
jgi:hypothetical protein